MLASERWILHNAINDLRTSYFPDSIIYLFYDSKSYLVILFLHEMVILNCCDFTASLVQW